MFPQEPQGEEEQEEQKEQEASQSDAVGCRPNCGRHETKKTTVSRMMNNIFYIDRG